MASFANSQMMCVPAEKCSEGQSSGGGEEKRTEKLIRCPELNGTQSPADHEVLFGEEDSKHPLRSSLKCIFRLVRTPKFGTYASQNVTSLTQPEALLFQKRA